MSNNNKKIFLKALHLMAIFVKDTKLKEEIIPILLKLFKTNKTEKEPVFLDTSYEAITLTSKPEKDTLQSKYSSIYL